MVSIRASEQGAEQIKYALRAAKVAKGWQRSDFRWLQAASLLLGRSYEETGYLAEGISQKTWQNFLGKKPIRAKTFQIYCEVLELDWMQIYESSDLEDLGFIATPKFFSDQILYSAKEMHRRGIIIGAYESLRQINYFLKNYKNTLSPQLIGDFHLLFGAIQMQRGKIIGEDGAFQLAKTSISFFSQFKDKNKLAESYQLLGLCFLQERKFQDSINSYQNGILALEDDKKLTNTKMRILHDIAHSTLRLSMNLKLNDSILDHAEENFKNSNEFFESENPDFRDIAKIRTAEMYINSGQISLAEDILNKYEDLNIYSALILPYQALFLRINAERYLALNQQEKAMQILKSALLIDHREGYAHQIQSIDRLIQRHQLKLTDCLPNNFDVYTWPD